MAPSVGIISVTWNKTVKHQDKKLSTRFAFYYLEKKNFHVLEQSKQNIEMGIVKKTMNREYRNGRFLFEVFLLRYHEGVAIMDVILHYDQARPFRVSYFLSVRRNNLFPLYGFFKNFIWMSCFYHLSSLRCFSFRCLFAHWRPQRIPLLVLVVFPLPL